VTSDDAAAKRFMKEKGIAFASLTGETLALAAEYGVAGTPHTFVLDREGRVYFARVGFDEKSGDEALTPILELLLARPAAQHRER
jgi:hypothetical protein